MKNEGNISLTFLEKQLAWCKEQDRILEEIEATLYEMKAVAEYAAENKLDPFEIKALEEELVTLQQKVTSLEKHLQSSKLTH